MPFNYAVGEQFIKPKFDPLYQDIELNQILAAAPTEARRGEITNRAIDYTKRSSINFIGVKKEKEGKKQHFTI